MHIILFGFQCCGKTHFGQLLAQILQRPFIDTDQLIVTYSRQPLSIRNLHQTLEEKHFRLLESAVLSTLIDQPDSVIALGSGTLLNADNVHFLRSIGHLIYLEARFETLLPRILNRGVPSFTDPFNPERSLQEIYNERKALYESLDAPRIPVDLPNDAAILHSLGAACGI